MAWRPSDPEHDTRTLFLVGSARDAELAHLLLGSHGFAVTVCDTIDQLIEELASGAGVLLLAEERLLPGACAQLAASLRRQPSWSEIPILVATKPGRQSISSVQIEALGNVTLLERPVRLFSLTSALRSALRARRRQYETRDAIRNRDHFLAMLGHELRNPLAAIDLAVHRLEPGATGKPLEIVARQTKNLGRIVDDLLEIGRITRGELEIERAPVDLRGVVAASVDAVGAAAEREDIALEVRYREEGAPIEVTGDRVRLEQILANLLTNAVKFTPAGGRITVSVDRGDDEAEIRVCDTGVGIPPHMLERIFGLFVQAQTSLSRRKGGLGLGLKLVRTLVEMHGGTVRAESDGPGRGSTFVVRLPLRAPEAAPGPSVPSPTASRARGPVRVLVVDDMEDIRESLVVVLDLYGYQATPAATGEEAIALLSRERFDVAFVDIGLPDVDGFEVARRVRAAGIATALVAVSGFGREQDRHHALASGYDLHLTKPAPVERLLDVLAEVAGP